MSYIGCRVFLRKVFWRNPKQICVKLHRYKWKSKLVDENKNWKQFAVLWILHNTGYDGGCIESASLLVVPNAQFYKWLKNIVWSNGIGCCLINFYFHCILCDVFINSFRTCIYTEQKKEEASYPEQQQQQNRN